MSQPDPIPSDFGVRYMWRFLWWFLWTNPVSILSTVQAVFTAITLDPTLLNHQAFHVISICNLVAIVIIAQVKKRNPSPPPPIRSSP